MAVLKKTKFLLLFITLMMGNFGNALAQQVDSPQVEQTFLTRGEAMHHVVETFGLRDKNAKFIGNCLLHLDECFFVFTAMTRYDQVSLEPLRLYPDVPEAYLYSSDVNLATMLGLVHGNIDEKGSPFYPRAYMTRIHALKVVLGAAELMDWREKFELVRDLGNEDALRNETSLFGDVNALRDDSWWYPRYVNFALDAGIIDAAAEFKPNEPITALEYNDMLQRALKKSVEIHAVTVAPTDAKPDSKNQP